MHDLYRKFPVLIGLTLLDAMPLIKKSGFSPRFYQTDGKKVDLGNSFQPMRVNLSIDKGIVINYSFY